MNDLQVLAQPHRQRILRLVWEDEVTAGDIADQFDVSFGAVSQHLRILRDAGMVQVRRDGNRRFYSADRGRLEPYRAALAQAWGDTLDQLVRVIEDDVDA